MDNYINQYGSVHVFNISIVYTPLYTQCTYTQTRGVVGGGHFITLYPANPILTHKREGDWIYTDPLTIPLSLIWSHIY